MTAGGPTAARTIHHTISERVRRLHGCRDLAAVFTGDRALVPWPRAPRIPGSAQERQAAFAAMLAGPPHVADLDPRILFANQPWVVRHHAAYYLTGRWERTGTTSADRHLDANRYPLVHLDPAGRHIILGGHHRSLAALVEGRPVRARILRTDPGEAVPVVPLLLVGERSSLPHRTAADEHQAALHVARGETVLVPDLECAWSTLELVGLRPDAIEDRVLYANEGQCFR
jgi:hypothetical protein